MTLNYSDVGEILKMIDASSCAEVVLELDGIKMIVRKDGQRPAFENTKVTSGSVQSGELDKPNDSINSVTYQTTQNKADFSKSSSVQGGLIKSPMVGTYYSKPSPDDESFVVAGKKVKKGDTLCLIEVMKLFTAVECTIDGTVETIFLEDGALVEFDQPLFSII